MAAEREQWDTQASTYDASRAQDPIYMAAVHRVVSALDVTADDTVLDAACGTGLTVRQYQPRGARVVAMDLSLDSLVYLRRHLANPSNVEFVCGEMTALPLATGIFTKVLSANALQHLPEPAQRTQAVADLARVASPGSRVVISAHNFSRSKARAGWDKEGRAGGSTGSIQYIYRFDPQEFAALLQQSLQVTEVTGAGLPLPYRYKLSPIMRMLERRLNRLPQSAAWGNLLVGVGTRPDEPRG